MCTILDSQSFQELEDLHLNFQSKNYNKDNESLSNLEFESFLNFVDNISTANLGNLSLKYLPNSVYYLLNLRKLDISSNELQEIQNNGINWKILKNIDISNNKIAEIPIFFLNLAYLEFISLSNNIIENIPFGLGNLCNLEELDLSCNKIIDIHPIMSISSLRSLKMSYNKINIIPSEISNLKKLVILDCRANRIKKLPHSLSQLIELESFHLSNNPLTFPPLNVVSRGLPHILAYLCANVVSSLCRPSMNSQESLNSIGYKNASPINLVQPSNDMLLSNRQKIRRNSALPGINFTRPLIPRQGFLKKHRTISENTSDLSFGAETGLFVRQLNSPRKCSVAAEELCGVGEPSTEFLDPIMSVTDSSEDHAQAEVAPRTNPRATLVDWLQEKQLTSNSPAVFDGVRQCSGKPQASQRTTISREDTRLKNVSPAPLINTSFGRPSQSSKLQSETSSLSPIPARLPRNHILNDLCPMPSHQSPPQKVMPKKSRSPVLTQPHPEKDCHQAYSFSSSIANEVDRNTTRSIHQYSFVSVDSPHSGSPASCRSSSPNLPPRLYKELPSPIQDSRSQDIWERSITNITEVEDDLGDRGSWFSNSVFRHQASVSPVAYCPSFSSAAVASCSQQQLSLVQRTLSPMFEQNDMFSFQPSSEQEIRNSLHRTFLHHHRSVSSKNQGHLSNPSYDGSVSSLTSNDSADEPRNNVKSNLRPKASPRHRPEIESNCKVNKEAGDANSLSTTSDEEDLLLPPKVFQNPPKRPSNVLAQPPWLPSRSRVRQYSQNIAPNQQRQRARSMHSSRNDNVWSSMRHRKERVFRQTAKQPPPIPLHQQRQQQTEKPNASLTVSQKYTEVIHKTMDSQLLLSTNGVPDTRDYTDRRKGTALQLKLLLESRVGLSLPDEPSELAKALRSGIYLATFVNNLLGYPIIKKIHDVSYSSEHWQYRAQQNLFHCCDAIRSVGVPRHRLFSVSHMLESNSTVGLFGLLHCIQSLLEVVANRFNGRSGGVAAHLNKLTGQHMGGVQHVGGGVRRIIKPSKDLEDEFRRTQTKLLPGGGVYSDV